MKICLIQNCPSTNKDHNLVNIYNLIPNKEIDILVFPECFNSPYGIEHFKNFAEELTDGNKTYDFLQNLSKKLNNTYIVAGSIPEKDGDKIYNTSSVWNNGSLIATYRKNNLFDINITESEFKESKVISSGSTLTIFQTPLCKIGIGICFDLRFNQISNIYSKEDCKIIIYPASFTEYTGKLHWSILNQARAIDSHAYIISCATARNDTNKFKSYGHSIMVSPWGDILNELDNKEGYIYQEIDLSLVDNMRQTLPVDQCKPFNL